MTFSVVVRVRRQKGHLNVGFEARAFGLQRCEVLLRQLAHLGVRLFGEKCARVFRLPQHLPIPGRKRNHLLQARALTSKLLQLGVIAQHRRLGQLLADDAIALLHGRKFVQHSVWSYSFQFSQMT